MDREEYLDTFDVPQNTEYDLNILNYTFTYRSLIEGGVLALLSGAIMLAILTIVKLKLTYSFALVVFVALLGFALGVIGINGDSISNYLLNALKFARRRRVAYYNPRVKKEIKFFADTKEDDYVVPRERLEALYRSFISKKDVEEAQINLTNEDFDSSLMYFEDDIDAVGKPEEMLSKKERKKIEKQRRVGLEHEQ